MQRIPHSIRMALAVATFAVAVAAQDPLPSAAAPERNTQQQAASAEQPRVSIDFAGGTLGELLDTLRARDRRVNIVAAPECNAVAMPPMALHDASVHNALRAAAEVASSHTKVLVACQSDKGGAPVYALSLLARAESAPSAKDARPAAPRPRIAVFSLRMLTEPWAKDVAQKPVAMKTETILAAIAAGTQGSGLQPPQLQWHEDSGLLFVYGDLDQVAYVQEVLRKLEEGQEHLRRVAPRINRANSADSQPSKDAPKDKQ